VDRIDGATEVDVGAREHVGGWPLSQPVDVGRVLMRPRVLGVSVAVVRRALREEQLSERRGPATGCSAPGRLQRLWARPEQLGKAGEDRVGCCKGGEALPAAGRHPSDDLVKEHAMRLRG